MTEQQCSRVGAARRGVLCARDGSAIAGSAEFHCWVSADMNRDAPGPGCSGQERLGVSAVIRAREWPSHRHRTGAPTLVGSITAKEAAFLGTHRVAP